MVEKPWAESKVRTLTGAFTMAFTRISGRTDRLRIFSLLAGFLAAPIAGAATLDASLEPRQRFVGRVATPLDVDVIAYPALEGSELTVIATAIGGTQLEPRLRLLQGGIDLEPELIVTGKGGREERWIRVRVPATGEVTIEVSGRDESLGDYRLRIRERLPTKLQWKPKLSTGASKSFPFVARAGDAMTLEVERLDPSPMPMPMPTLVTPDGENVALDEFAHALEQGIGVGPVALGEDGAYRIELSAGAESEHLSVRIGLAVVKGAGATITEAPGSVRAAGSVFLENGDWLPSEADEFEAADFAANELIVRFSSAERASAVSERLGLEIVSQSPDGTALLRRRGAPPFSRAADPGERDWVRRWSASARAESGVAFAEPNFLRSSFATQNDVLYSQQWDFPAATFDLAADVEDGDSARTIAVLDTGVRFDHPDLAGRFTAGFDFVSDSWNGGDGNGLDSDPTDPILAQGTHGTHVSGTIVAARGNGIGIAGAIGSGKVLPLRVLGVLGGTDYDISQAILYAARLPNVSGTLPAQRAEVINMSLGGPYPSATLDAAVQQAIAAGVVVVAAAGNANSKTKMYPAGIDGVIAVGATDRLDERAFYSSFGPHLSLAAPGGDPWVDADGDGFTDGVLSTVVDPYVGPTYARKSGTSMAAPHVAAAAFLLRAARPELSPFLVRSQLCASARDLGAPGPDKFHGYGLLDADAALKDLLGLGVGDKAAFAFPSAPTFSIGIDERELGIVELGNGPTGELIGVAETAFWLESSFVPGALPRLIELSVDRSGLLPGLWSTTIELQTTFGVETVPVTVEVEDTAAPPLVPRAFVVAWDVGRREVASVVEITDVDDGAFEFVDLPEGTYRFFAATDLDLDLVIGEAHDYAGAALHPITGDVRFALADGEEEPALVMMLGVGGGSTSMPKGDSLALATDSIASP